MNSMRARAVLLIAVLIAAGCQRAERGPLLAGGRAVKSWLADLHDARPKVRRQAVLKLGNVGEADPSVAEGLTGALRDPDVLVRGDAVHAIAKLTKPTEAIISELKAMSQGDRDARVRDYAQRALTHFGVGE